MHLIDLHLIEVHLIDLHLIYLHLIDLHLIYLHLIDLHLIDLHLVEGFRPLLVGRGWAWVGQRFWEAGWSEW